MKRFAFSFVLLGLAAVFTVAQGDRSTRTRVATAPEPKAPTIQNDTVRSQGERRPPVFATPNGGRPSATPVPGSTNDAAIGDSDEDDYMWPTLGSTVQQTMKKTTLDVDKLTQRRMLFLSAVEK
ncbi:MAG: hypothetical protein ABL984_05690, partial [Pyrinomonadaceae bacterium]